MKERHSVDLADVLSTCISEFKKVIVFRGGPLTWCPAGDAPSPSPAA